LFSLGFVFGIVNFALAMLAMSILLMLYWVYLKKTKKGNMKTSAPMGPFLSAGVMLIIATILF
jgi:cbb3-type cytochrome oxidase subunit 3